VLKKFIGNSSLYLLASMLNRGVAFLLLPLYTSHLSPADYGIIAICTSVYGVLLPLFTVNLHAAVNLFYFKLDKDEYQKLLSSIWLWFLIVPLLIVGILEIVGSNIAGDVFQTVPWHPYIRLAVWVALLNVAQEIPLAILYAEQKAAKYAILTTVFFLITTGFTIYFVVWRQAGALGSLQGQAIGFFIVSLISHFIIARRFDSWRQITVVWKHLRSALRLSAPTVPYLFFMWAMNLSDRWVLSYFVSTSEIGIYTLAYTIGTIIGVVGVSLRGAFTPAYYEQYQDPLFRARLPQLLSVYLTIVTLAALTISLLAPETLKIMASPAYYEAWKFVPLIATAYWAYAGFYILSLSVIENGGRTEWMIFLAAPPAVLNLILNWFLVPYFGVWATAATTALAFFMMAAAAHFASRRIDKLPYSWTAVSSMIIVAVAAYLAGTFWFTFENLAAALIAKIILLFFAAGLMLIGSGLSYRQISTLYTRFRAGEKSAA
jgi:O-antigen/teichoic acid export membrane protein